VDGCGLDGWPGWPARPGEEQYSYEVPRLATGVKQRVAKLRALGNAVVPLQALPVFTAIMQAERQEALHMQAEQEGAR
jgi:DNA (cytosine-5)-methyltransferase 1